ncbi:MAG: hypothetical protein JST80_02780 [Bdellovibrionales bacterium]|nr:hypothetical protein [Bdellovibrionales bacterium]
MKNLWLIWVWIAALFFLNTAARAQVSQSHQDPYFEISSITNDVQDVYTEALTDETLEFARRDFQAKFAEAQGMQDATTGMNPPSADINPYAIAQILFNLWDIVLEGKPVVNLEVKNASALPVAANYNWSQLTGWRPERVVTSNLEVKNLLGMKTIAMHTAIKLMFGGGFKGRGMYIASARVVPSAVKVLNGYNLDVAVAVPSVTNVGREDDPNASIQLDITYKIWTRVKKTQWTDSFIVQGDGFMQNKKSAEVYFEAIDHVPAPPLPSPTPEEPAPTSKHV